MKIKKSEFKASVENYLMTLYRKNVEDATRQQMFQAVSYAIKEYVVDDWFESHKAIEEKDGKIVYYMSMEFLMGRALGNNLLNLCGYQEVKEALDEMGSFSRNALDFFIFSFQN